jgi:nitrate/nitrite-specific signal transduction histidine kinase
MRAFACLVLVFAFLAIPAEAAEMPPAGVALAINKAGRQRMLSQRIVRSYALGVLGVTRALANEDLKDAVRNFDRQLADLKAVVTGSDARESLREVEQQWARFRPLALGPSSREGAEALNAAGERLLRAAERSVAALERHAKTPHARFINLAGRQRMLSQRIAKGYLLLALGTDSDGARQELHAAIGEFDETLAQLRTASAGNEALRSEFSIAAAQWEMLRAVAGGEPRSATDSLAVVEAADAILHRMERITLIYQRLAAAR